MLDQELKSPKVTPPELRLEGAQFKDLFNPVWLQEMDARFLERLKNENSKLHADLLAYRHRSQFFSPEAISALLLACAPLVEEWIAQLFQIQSELLNASQEILSNQPIFAFKQWYVQRQARRRLLKQDTMESFIELDHWLNKQLDLTIPEDLRHDRELAVASLGIHYLKEPETYSIEIESLTRWCVRALTDPEGKAAVHGWVSFHFPKKMDYEQLVYLQPVRDDPVGRLEGEPSHFRPRDGFDLTDPRMTQRQVLNEIDYCVYCHDKEGDFCSKGFPVKKGEPEKGLKTNSLGELQTGCPLEEKISEMHVLKKEGYTIAALAMTMVDNPMCPATGHRICNDCMKACIYQKQEPVNIPQTETGILTDVLKLPWGVEIYDLLTRWNPLRREQWVAKPYNGLKVLVMGMGPAGFSLAHHLLMEGCAVVGADGLKIEPLPTHYLDKPIYCYESIQEPLSDRILAGFGGVAEYGITVRWDKNFLKLIYISLMRRPYFQVFGGVRFGGTLKIETARALGFHHLAIAVGAGLPKALPIPGSMAPGMRQANDFLMALQLTGAAKHNSLANLQIRLPAVVIGGGLTGIDTATEVQAYYIAQVEKILERYEQLAMTWGEARLREQFYDQDGDGYHFSILNEFLTHGRRVRQERQQAKSENRKPDFIPLLREWGGVTIAYRRLLRESPAYLRNHEEVEKAFEEGIYYVEGLTPKMARLDAHGHVEALVSDASVYDENRNWVTTDEAHVLPARSILVATGARPNIAYEFEHRGSFQREGHNYQGYDVKGEAVIVHPNTHIKSEEFGAFTSYQQEKFRVTFLGDTHPVFHGSVVKAIASAKKTYPDIMRALSEAGQTMGGEEDYPSFAKRMQDEFSAVVHTIVRHTPSVIEIEVKAPLAARNFLPGQFYRLQNFETLAPCVGNTVLQTEGVAVLGRQVDHSRQTLNFLILEQGASSRILATLKPGEPIALMGPTGVRTKIPQDGETILVIGGRLSAAYLLSIGAHMRAAGNKVFYVGGFKTADEIFCQKELENAADKILWVTEYGEPIQSNRPQDISIVSELIPAITQYAQGLLEAGGAEIPLQSVDRILLVGKFPFLCAMRQAQQTVLKEFLTKNPKVIASIYGPMQCMLKGVCAQCLVWQIDPDTGGRTKAVFACSWQDQPFEWVDLNNLQERLEQNRVQEILTDLWLDYLLSTHQVDMPPILSHSKY